MNQTERRMYLIRELLQEAPQYGRIEIPTDRQHQEKLLRTLMNVRPPKAVSREFVAVQDAYLQEEVSRKGITEVKDLKPVRDGLYLWQGDITTLRCDGIVNAANSGMLGCFIPCHGCIDNAIHTYAGVQLRAACSEQMRRQGCEEETGRAKITPAYNLPSTYVLHTVGPIVHGEVTEADRELLASCYRSCLALAEKNGLKSLAFCCISTGEFHFPNDEAAKIAISTVRQYRMQKPSGPEVIFNVFKDQDYGIYRRLLDADGAVGKGTGTG